MRIVVNDVAAQMGGAITLLKEFRDYIVENDRENEWIFLLSKPYIEEASNVRVIVYESVKKSPLHRVWYDLTEGKRIEKTLKPDLFFSMQNTLFKGVKTPQAVYMHQSLPFQQVKKFSPFKRSELKSWYYSVVVGGVIKRGLPKASAIIVQTNWIKDAIINLFPETASKITVVTPKVITPLRDESIEWSVKEFFAPITDVSYKNADCIYKALDILKTEGFNDLNVTLSFEGENSHEHVTNIGFVSRDELFRRYQSATMVFPSYIETFGLPMAEARKMGTIVLASSCPFSHEILDDYENAYFFDPFKPEELAGLMRDILEGIIVKKPFVDKTEQGGSWENVIRKITEEKK